MSDEVSIAPVAWARLVLRRFAAASNLLIAGRRFAIVGGGDTRAAALHDVLIAMGARAVASGEADYLFVVAGTPGTVGATRSQVIVDATDEGLPTFGEGIRRDVFATSRPAMFQVRAAVDRGRVPLGDARGRIEWARRFMPVTESVVGELATSGVLAGMRVGVSMVLEPKTAVLAQLLESTGAIVSVFAHPDEFDAGVAAVLRDEGIAVFGSDEADAPQHLDSALAFLRERPQLLVDDGSHLIRLAHTDLPEVLDTMIGAAEETTSGLRPLRLMADVGALRVPVVAVNDARSKTLFDNRWGTGQSCVFAIADLLEQDWSGMTVVVVGYGDVGEGVAHYARALGASVTVVETDPVRALQATYSGLRVQSLLDAVATADLVISATGMRDTITVEVLQAGRPDVAFAVAGGVDQEIAIDEAVAAGAVRETIAERIERFTFANGATARILDDGGCINITAGEGNPIQIMDLSFAVQCAALRHLVEHPDAPPAVYALPTAADEFVASTALRAAGYLLDECSRPAESAQSGWHTQRFGPRS